MSGLPLNVATSIAVAMFQTQLNLMDFDESQCLSSCIAFLCFIGDPECRRRLLDFFAALLHRRRIEGREALPGFAPMVLRYADVQFAEDFRMPREKFHV